MFFKVLGKLDLSKFSTDHKNIQIECFDKDVLADDKLGITNCDLSGNFSFMIPLSSTGEAYPELYFKATIENTIVFTSQVYQTKGLLDVNQTTGFIENSTMDVGCVNGGV